MKSFKLSTSTGEVGVHLQLTHMVDPELYLVHIKDGSLDVRIGSLSARKQALVAVQLSGASEVVATLDEEGELPAKDRDTLLQKGALILYEAWYQNSTAQQGY